MSRILSLILAFSLIAGHAFAGANPPPGGYSTSTTGSIAQTGIVYANTGVGVSGTSPSSAQTYMTINVPSAGTWLMNYAVRGQTASQGSGMSAALFSGAATGTGATVTGTLVAGSPFVIFYEATGNNAFHTTAASSTIVTTTGPTTYTIGVYQYAGGSSNAENSDSAGGSMLSYTQIAAPGTTGTAALSGVVTGIVSGNTTSSTTMATVVGSGFTIPSAGTYNIEYSVTATSVNGYGTSVQLYNGTTNTTVPNSMSNGSSGATNIPANISGGALVTLTGATNFVMQWASQNTSGTASLLNNYSGTGSTNGYGESIIRWTQVGAPAVGQFGGASSTIAGLGGYVPAPIAGQQGSILNGSGAWVAPIGTQNFTFSGTYTPTPGMAYAVIEVQGAGGSGAGSVATTASQCSLGSAGAAGGYAKALLTAAQIGTSQTITIGNGGAAANGNGNSGGTTSLGALITSVGGTGGNASGTVTTYTAQSGATGGTSTVSSGALFVNISGAIGGNSYCNVSGNITIVSPGGSSQLGIGAGYGPGTGSSTSKAGTGYGSGSSGTANLGLNSALSSVAGQQGIIIITEYY